MMKKIAILGSTGSIGTSTLRVVDTNPDRYRVVAELGQPLMTENDENGHKVDLFKFTGKIHFISPETIRQGGYQSTFIKNRNINTTD